MRLPCKPARRDESGRGVHLLTPKGAIEPTGTWSLGARAGDFVYVAGMRGIDPASNKLVDGDEARIRQAFLNIKLIAESEGAGFIDCVRLTWVGCVLWSTRCGKLCGAAGPIRPARSLRLPA